MGAVTGARRKFGRYVILGDIAQGRISTVSCASDGDSGRILALKVIYLDRPEGSRNTSTAPALPDTLARDLARLSSLHHPNIPTLFEYGVLDGKLYLASALIDGVPLTRLLHDHAPIPPGRAVAITAAVANALGFANGAGLVHGTLDASDILICPDDRVYVTGFGTGSLATAPEKTGARRPDAERDSGESAFADVRASARLLKRMLSGQKLPGNLKSLFKVADAERGSVAGVHDARTFQLALETLCAGLSSTQARKIEKADPPRWLAPGLATAVILAGSALAGWHLLTGSDKHAVTVIPGNQPDIQLATGGGSSNAASPVVPRPTQTGPVEDRLPAPAPTATLISVQPATPSADGSALPSSATTAPPDPESPAAGLPESLAATLVSTAPCAILTIDDGVKDSIKVKGMVAGPDALHEAAGTLPKTVADQPVTLELGEAPAPFCDVLTLLAEARKRDLLMPQPMAITFPTTGGSFQGGQDLLFDLHGPDDPVHLQIDYFAADGSVVHLLPNPLEPNSAFAASTTRRLGERHINSRHWTIAPPFGVELIVAIATPNPLFSSPRPEAEPSVVYMTDLRQALSAASDGDAADGNHTAPRAAAYFITTMSPPSLPASETEATAIAEPATNAE